MKRIFVIFVCVQILMVCPSVFGKTTREERRKQELEKLQERFAWWPTDAMPAPVKDTERNGYWWMPRVPGTARPWGNRGYIYLYKVIYDYKAEDEDELQAVAQDAPRLSEKAPEPKPSLLIKKVIRNIKIYFDYNKAELRDDHFAVLENAVKTLGRNPQASILVTGNCDARGSSEYNQRLGNKRADAVKHYMLGRGIDEGRILIISRGKLDAVAPVTDLVGMQKDRNAQFMIAEVQEVLMSGDDVPQGADVKRVKEGEYFIEKQEKIETAVRVSTKEYTVQKNDTLSKIAQKELGAAHRWKYLYELNKDRIKDFNVLSVGQKIMIPVE